MSPHLCEICPPGFPGCTGTVCAHCDHYFETNEILNIHIAVLECGGSHPCERCGAKFVNLGLLERHLAEFNCARPRHWCEECGIGYAKLSGLVKHIYYIHPEIKEHRCVVYRKKYISRNGLLRHYRNNHNCLLDKKEHMCAVCGKLYCSRNGLVRHNREKH